MSNLLRETTGYIQRAPMYYDARPVIMTEGGTDVDVYSKVFDTKVGLNGTKAEVIRWADNISEDQRDQGRGIIDRDYDEFVGLDLSDLMLVYTDCHSLETVMWYLDSEKTLLSEILRKIMSTRDFDRISPSIPNLYALAYETAYFMGLVRIVNEQNRYGVSQTVPLCDELFDGQHINEDAYIKRLLLGEKQDRYEYLDQLDELKARQYDQWKVMRGHDISDAFVYHIKQLRCRITDHEIRSENWRTSERRCRCRWCGNRSQLCFAERSEAERSGKKSRPPMLHRSPHQRAAQS